MEKEGGPRLWWALARRMRRLVWRRSIKLAPLLSGTANEAVEETCAAMELPSESTAPGYIGHFTFAWNAAPDSEASAPVDIEQ